MSKRKQRKKGKAQKKKSAEFTPDGSTSAEQKPGTQNETKTGAKWVSITVDDVKKAMTPEMLKVLEDESMALSCPDSETAKLTPEQKEMRAKYIEEKWSLYHTMEEMFRKAGNEARHAQAVDAIYEFNRQAEIFARNTPHLFKISYSPHYISTLAGLSCQWLQRMAQRGNQHAITNLAKLTVEMAETLTDLLSGDTKKVEANSKLMRRLAESLPYWPMLQFRHAAANNHFPRVADLLHLGKDCPINATEQANYSMQTPINSFVWGCLKHFDEVHWIIRHSESHKGKAQTFSEIAAAGENAERVFEQVAAGKFNINAEKKTDDPIERALEPYVFTETDKRRFGMIYRQDIPIYKESFKLAPLTKSNAQQWADSAIMPYVRNRIPDLRQVEELHYLREKVGPEGKRYAPVRKAVIQAMQQIARNA